MSTIIFLILCGLWLFAFNLAMIDEKKIKSILMMIATIVTTVVAIVTEPYVIIIAYAMTIIFTRKEWSIWEIIVSSTIVLLPILFPYEWVYWSAIATILLITIICCYEILAFLALLIWATLTQ